MDDDILTVNDYNGLHRSVSKSGKARYSISIRAEPVLVNVDPRSLTRGPAEAIAKHLRDSILGITAEAAPFTRAYRERAAKAINEGADWALKRYSGGRMGTALPNRSSKLFNDSRRLVESIKVGPTKDGWAVNVAANRLDPTTLNNGGKGGEAALLRVHARLKELVPAWGDGKMLADVLSVQAAVRQSVKEMTRKLVSEKNVQLEREVMRRTFGIVRQVFGMVG